MTVEICYKTNKPITYNKGTQYEITRNTFLAYYYSGNNAQTEVERINREAPERLFNNELAKCNERIYFVGNEQ